jgi:hypothetical protein
MTDSPVANLAGQGGWERGGPQLAPQPELDLAGHAVPRLQRRRLGALRLQAGRDHGVAVLLPVGQREGARGQGLERDGRAALRELARALRWCRRRRRHARLGFGRIVVPEKDAPNILVILV